MVDVVCKYCSSAEAVYTQKAANKRWKAWKDSEAYRKERDKVHEEQKK